ncbi:MAG: aminodeoxychorismate/anthranilate synthase component II [Candidatus Omnitrophota bacterium]
MMLVIDNYDSFTYNLVQYVGELGGELIVHRNDKVTLGQIEDLSPESIIISPGPGRPDDAGISKEVIKKFAGKIPILGVCLGHQCIAEVYGAEVARGSRIMHGKVSDIYHNGEDIFKNIPSPFTATRYHSLIVKPGTLKDPLELTAWTDKDEIMGVRHKSMKVWGVQFHPESILTEEGKNILKNFLEEAK